MPRFLPAYQRLSDAVHVCRTHVGALVLGLATVAVTCLLNYLAAISAGNTIPLPWVFLLTPLTAFAPLLPSIASGLGWNQGVYIVLYHTLARAVPAQPSALAMSLAMQALVLTASLPRGILWWQRRQASPRERMQTPSR